MIKPHLLRKKKLPVSTILYALGLNSDKIIETFYTIDKYSYDSESKMWSTFFEPENFKRPIKISYDLIDAKTKKKLLSKGDKLNYVIAKKLSEKNLKNILISPQDILGKYVANDLKDNNGEAIIKAGFEFRNKY